MVIKAAPSPKDIADQMQKVVVEQLNAHGVYQLDSYGWLNADDCDPEFIGHAMWQTDSLSFRVLEAQIDAMQSRSATLRELKPWEQFLIISGGDFEGLMEAARLSIGLALFQREAVTMSFPAMDSLFGLHIISAMVTLGAASDRLRDLFIAAVFHRNTKKYEDGQWLEARDRYQYEAPFREAAANLQSAAVATESSAKLPVLSREIQTYRRERNAIVHDLATDEGRRHRDIADNPPVTTHADYEKLDFAALHEASARAEAEHHRRISDDLDRPIRWYKLLVELSNHVFIVEHALRLQRSH